MFDVFYLGNKPGLFLHERSADSIQHACAQSRTRFCWIVDYLCDYTGFDFLWEPSPWQADQRHAWASQHQKDSGTYLVPRSGYQDTNYHPSPIITRLPHDQCWQRPDHLIEDFDWSWHPDPTEPPMIYQFGTQHQATGGPRYVVAGSSTIKYMDRPRAAKISVDAHWLVPSNMNIAAFDWTWHPDDRDPPYCYQFPTQWNRAGGPEYQTPGAQHIKFITVQQARMLPVTDRWHIPPDIDINSFDFSWTPDPTEPPYIYEFGTQWQKTGGPRYVIPGSTEIKYINTPRACKIYRDDHWEVPSGTDIESFDWTWHPDSTDAPFIYQFGTQWQKTGGPRYVIPGSTEIKYINTPRSRKIDCDDHWEVPSGTDIESFDWTWHPDSTDAPFIYQFGTQHQRTGGPRYVMPRATEIKYVDQIRIKTQQVATAIIEIDHLDGNAGKIPDTVRTSRYFDNYLDTLRRIAKNVGTEHEFIWICSSICDYTDFDFSWHPEQWQVGMLHVFPSGDQKFGDTFFMHVPTFQYRADVCQLLEWYDVNFITHTSVPRRNMPVIQHDNDSHVEPIKTSPWSGPLALFTNRSVDQSLLPVVPLWREKTKTIVPLDVGGSAVIVPRAAVAKIRTQVYDYDYIDRSHTNTLQDRPLDIVFISNGEHGADHHWEILNQSVPTQQNRIHRVDGVNGRVAAYQAAAGLSTTPWFFAVFAKLQVNADFDWRWQPDRLQQPKHYIFHAYNPVNHLIYGHQAMIAYNRSMTLTNTAQGLDFTLDQAHEVVPMLSGTAYYDNDPWMTWRTAFREALKLRHSLPDVENEYRLGEWLNKGEGVNGHWSMRGSQDAVEYYDQINGDFSELRRSYEWAWLASYAMVLHPELFTHAKT